MHTHTHTQRTKSRIRNKLASVTMLSILLMFSSCDIGDKVCVYMCVLLYLLPKCAFFFFFFLAILGSGDILASPHKFKCLSRA